MIEESCAAILSLDSEMCKSDQSRANQMSDCSELAILNTAIHTPTAKDPIFRIAHSRILLSLVLNVP